MRIFLPIAALAVGLANALLLSGFGDSPWGGPFVWKIQTGPLFTAHMLSAVLAGFTVSGALPLCADRKLRGGFFARYLLMWAAICGGGAILGVFWHGSIMLLDERVPMPRGLGILFDVAFPAAAGSTLGIFAGAYLGLPLAWLLGVFGSPTPVRDG